MGETLYSNVTYVAVNQDFRESKLNLLWTLKTLRVKKLCLLQVHIPFSLNPSCKYIFYIHSLRSILLFLLVWLVQKP